MADPASGLTKELRGHPMLPASYHELAANVTEVHASASASAAAVPATPAVATPTTPLVVNTSTAAAAASLAKAVLANGTVGNLTNASLQLLAPGFSDDPNAAAGILQTKEDEHALDKRWVIAIVFATVILPVVLISCCCMCKPRTPWADKPADAPAAGKDS